jgi:hypothetical protein
MKKKRPPGYDDQGRLMVKRPTGHEDREQLMMKRLPGLGDREQLMCCVWEKNVRQHSLF